MKSKARVIAFYLPQFHPIPENDENWGKGFTEWTNVVQAKPLFKNHDQPRIPADLGFYDLRLSEVREAQAKMAQEHGVEGFMYWHYWFGNGKMLLEKPFQEVLSSGKPDFPFCLGWANHSWSTKTWVKDKALKRDKMIAEQLYPGEEDYRKHFDYVLPAFKDKRYITVDGCPVFNIYDPLAIPDIQIFMKLWREMAVENGLKGIHFIGYRYGRNATVEKFKAIGFDGIISLNTWEAECKSVGNKWLKMLRSQISFKFGGALLQKYDYREIIDHLFVDEDKQENIYPTILPGYDRTARSARQAIIYHGSTPKLFGKHVDAALKLVEHKKDEHKLIFLKSWNEWGEANYMEPDLKHGLEYLKELKKFIFK
jgi:hypothetical protein